MTLDNILEEINKAKNIVILTHENPDGDAVGSSLALYNALINYGKTPEVIIPEYSKTFEFLPGIEAIKKEGSIKEYDLAIALDCPDIKRLNGFANYFEDAKKTIVIDHHGTNTMFGDLNFVDPASPACAQILSLLLDCFNMEITKDIGICLLTGIITDTGGFKYSGVSPETFEFVSELMKKGVNLPNVYRRVLQVKTKSSFELEKIAISRLEFFESGKIAFTYIDKKDEDKVNFQTGDQEGIVEKGRDIEGVEVSIFLREDPEKQGYKISLRSNEYVNVADVALMFNGGGHIHASGGFAAGTVEQVKEKILAEVKKVIK